MRNKAIPKKHTTRKERRHVERIEKRELAQKEEQENQKLAAGIKAIPTVRRELENKITPLISTPPPTRVSEIILATTSMITNITTPPGITTHHGLVPQNASIVHPLTNILPSANSYPIKQQPYCKEKEVNSAIQKADSLEKTVIDLIGNVNNATLQAEVFEKVTAIETNLSIEFDECQNRLSSALKAMQRDLDMSSDTYRDTFLKEFETKKSRLDESVKSLLNELHKKIEHFNLEYPTLFDQENLYFSNLKNIADNLAADCEIFQDNLLKTHARAAVYERFKDMLLCMEKTVEDGRIDSDEFLYQKLTDICGFTGTDYNRLLSNLKDLVQEPCDSYTDQETFRAKFPHLSLISPRGNSVTDRVLKEVEEIGVVLDNLYLNYKEFRDLTSSILKDMNRRVLINYEMFISNVLKEERTYTRMLNLRRTYYTSQRYMDQTLIRRIKGLNPTSNQYHTYGNYSCHPPFSIYKQVYNRILDFLYANQLECPPTFTSDKEESTVSTTLGIKAETAIGGIGVAVIAAGGIGGAAVGTAIGAGLGIAVSCLFFKLHSQNRNAPPEAEQEMAFLPAPDLLLEAGQQVHQNPN